MYSIEIEPRELVVALIDDDLEHIELFTRTLKTRVFVGRRVEVLAFTDPTEAMGALDAISPDGDVAILIDHRMPAASGLDWIGRLTAAEVGPVVLMTSDGCEETAREAFRLGAADYMRKVPALQAPERLERTIREALRHWKLDQTARTLSRQLKQSNEELAVANRRLAAMTERAHRFVDDAAHEFRTPLAVVSEFASLLSEGIGGPISSTQREYLDFIRTSASDLASLVDDFLDTSRLRAGTVGIDRRAQCPAEIVRRSLPIVQSRASQRGIRVVNAIRDDVPPVFADIGKLARGVVNLAMNAIKYGPEDSTVLIRARVNPTDVSIEVSDRGDGMDAEQLQRLFERFRRGSEVSETSSGVGLGLSIVSDIARMHFGRLDVRSAPGIGTTFSIRVPRADTRSAVTAAVQSWQADRVPGVVVIRLGARVDDAGHSTVLDALRDVLKPSDLLLNGGAGLSLVRVAQNGRVGIDEVRAVLAAPAAPAATVRSATWIELDELTPDSVLTALGANASRDEAPVGCIDGATKAEASRVRLSG